MTERRGRIVSIGTAIASYQPIEDDDEPDLSAWPPLNAASMSDEDWAAHDARVAEQNERRRISDDAKRLRQHRARVIDSGFPQRAVEWAEKADETTSLIRRVADWKHEESSVLVLSGSRGCGKTVAAAWWALRRSRSAPVFLRAPTFARSSRYEGDERDDLLRAPSLVLDDLGEEFLDAKGSFLVDLDELIDVFYGGRKPMIITTNCTKDVFLKRYGERIADRLRECGLWFSVGDASLRRKP
jgi:DNA replication protein DnaC